MVENVNLDSPAFAPVELASLGDRDEEVLREGYSDAADQGIRGTLLPNSSPGGAGGSLGFSATDPMPIIVDPDIPGASYVVNPGDITEKEGDAPRTNMPAGGYDRGVVRQVADTAMRKAVGASHAMTGKEEPMAKRGSSSKTSRRKSAGASKAPEVDLEHPAGEQPLQPRQPMDPEMAAKLPEKIISFDFGPPMGTMECRYHDIFREGNRLVLAWNVGCVAASKYKPAAMSQPIKVTVGREKEEYTVMSLGMEFTDETTDRFYIVLLIDNREPEVPQESPPEDPGYING